MLSTLAYRCFCISSNWKQILTELIFLKWIFQKNGYPKNFIDKCFKKFLISILLKKTYKQSKKNSLFLVLPYLGIISLQTRPKLQQALKSVLNWWKPEIVFNCQTSLSNSFCYKGHWCKDFISDVVYKFWCGLCNESC